MTVATHVVVGQDVLQAVQRRATEDWLASNVETLVDESNSVEAVGNIKTIAGCFKNAVLMTVYSSRCCSL